MLEESLKVDWEIALAESFTVFVMDATGSLDSLGSVAGIGTEKRKYYFVEKWE